MDLLKEAKNVFEIEIDGLKEVKDKLPANFNDIIATIKNGPGRCVVTGMGKSGLVGKKISATMASTGTRSFFMHPGEAYHGDLGMIHKGDVILAISNSGETEEVIKLIPFFKENGNKIIALTGKENSSLANHADFFIDIGVSKEACPLELAPTTSTTVTLAMGDAIAMALMKARGFQAENFAKFHPGGSLGRKLLTRVSDIMITENLPILKTDSHFEEVISIISSGRLGMGVIIDDTQLSGVITDGDIRRLLKNSQAKAFEKKAGEFASKNPVRIDVNEKLVVAETMMQERKISTLIVTEDGRFKGILQRYDI